MWLFLINCKAHIQLFVLIVSAVFIRLGCAYVFVYLLGFVFLFLFYFYIGDYAENNVCF